MRKHRLAELLLVNVIGMPYEEAHEEACRWEHVMSEAVEQKVYELLGRPTRSPYGNLIPGLDDFGSVSAEPSGEGPERNLAVPGSDRQGRGQPHLRERADRRRRAARSCTPPGSTRARTVVVGQERDGVIVERDGEWCACPASSPPASSSCSASPGAAALAQVLQR